LDFVCGAAKLDALAQLCEKCGDGELLRIDAEALAAGVSEETLGVLWTREGFEVEEEDDDRGPTLCPPRDCDVTGSRMRRFPGGRKLGR
jgi:hypothetical protein